MSVMNDPARSHRFYDAPVWLVGFRPFFTATCITGALFPLLWVLVVSGVITVPNPVFNPVNGALNWHMHEMFFGFGWALLGGFLLTATKNWVGIRGRHGLTLVVLVALWLLDRITMAFGGDWPGLVVYALSLPFMVLIVTLLEIDLVRNRANDSYKDNVYFMLALPLFVLAKLALLNGSIDPTIGWSMALGLFRVCFLVMLERTLEGFMKGAMGVSLKRVGVVDHAIKTLGLALVFAYWLPAGVQTALCLLLAALLALRWLYWHPFKALRRIDIGVMYLGYLAIIGNLLIQGLQPYYETLSISIGVHVFTLGAMGLIAPAMIVRISNGHTGRKVSFRATDKLAIYLMLGALISRVVLPEALPGDYVSLLFISALCWLVAFGIIGFRYIPQLFQPRVDGRAH
ncbi:MAG: hypothetical protein RIQ55_196 [Pseudomonadota bacterium]|jgi:uncharacterized protein involved in response to NO